jgi:23S rRNA pseudouridine955/2504/2580 synthase
MREMVLGEDDDGRRADRIVRKALSNASLSTIYRLFRQGNVQVESHSIKPDDRLKKGEVIKISMPEALIPAHDKKPEGAPSPSGNISSSKNGFCDLSKSETPRIIWQNRHLVAFHKPGGMLVHGGQASLNTYALGCLRDQLSPSVSFSPGPLHRLDRNTSGIVMFSKTRIGAEKFTAAIRNRQIRKFYISIAQGSISEPLLLYDIFLRDTQRHMSIVGKKGRPGSLYAVPLVKNGGYSLLLVELHTGITHQIRAQLAAHGLPLVGDSKYGGQKLSDTRSYFLHSYCLYLRDPLFGDMPSKIVDPLPGDFYTMVVALFDTSAEKLNTEILYRVEQLLEH